MLNEWKNMTKKDKLNYFKLKLNKGFCNSLKKERYEDFEDFMELFKEHPEYEIKLKNVIDLCIVANKRCRKYFEINLIKDDGSFEDISYRCCINKHSPNSNLLRALRYTIEPQIRDYRNNNELICDFCKSTDNIQIDHIIFFKDLVKDFLLNRTDIPTFFDDNEYNGCKFKLEDTKIRDEWYNFHKQNAKLRCLCSKCNLQRK